MVEPKINNDALWKSFLAAADASESYGVAKLDIMTRMRVSKLAFLTSPEETLKGMKETLLKSAEKYADGIMEQVMFVKRQMRQESIEEEFLRGKPE